MGLITSVVVPLRWLLVLPVALVGMYLAKWFGELCLHGALGFIDPIPDWAYQTARAFTGPFGFAWAGALVAPAYNRRVGIALASGWSVFYLGFMFYALQHSDRFETPDSLSGWLFVMLVTLATVGGSIAAILGIRKQTELVLTQTPNT